MTVIEKGAPAVGHVTEAQPAKGFGRKGKLNFSIDTVQALSGENIRLRSSKTATGADSYGKAGVIGLLTGPFAALVKAKISKYRPGPSSPYTSTAIARCSSSSRGVLGAGNYERHFPHKW